MNNEIEVKSSVNGFEFSDYLSDEVLDRVSFVGACCGCGTVVCE